MLNRVILSGRLTADPELRYTQSGTAVANFRLAVDRQFKNKDTNEREADFVNCILWRKSAENFCNFTHKGSLVGVDGRLQSRSYQNKDGQTVYVTEVVVDNFSLLEPKHGSNDDQGGLFGTQNQGHQTKRPPKQNNQQTDPFQQGGKPVDVSDDDLPF